MTDQAQAWTKEPLQVCGDSQLQALIVLAESGTEVAYFYYDNEDRNWNKTQEANAYLYASAHDLYEALEDALTTIKALHGPVAWGIYERSSPEMQRYNAALRKARGESP